MRQALLMFASLALLSPTSGVFAQVPTGPAVRLQVVFERTLKEKRVSSVPYTVAVVASPSTERFPGGPLMGRVRTGVQVPMRFETIGEDKRPVPGNVVYRDVGDAVECSATARDDGRFFVRCSFEQSSVGLGDAASAQPDPAQRPGLIPPVLRTFRSEAALVLGDGQTARHSGGVDRVTGETVNIDVTLTVLK